MGGILPQRRASGSDDRVGEDQGTLLARRPEESSENVLGGAVKTVSCEILVKPVIFF